jgi:hypothetical protein
MPFIETTLRQNRRPFASPLHRAYFALLLASRSKDGTRTITLARYGAFEVRLIELQGRRSSDASLSWLELYRHDIDTSVDSYRCDDLDEAETAAEHLVSSARELNARSPAPIPRRQDDPR